MLHVLLACTTAQPDSADTGDTADGAVSLQLTLGNTSVASALSTSEGATDIVLAPGLLLVHEPGWMLFSVGDTVAGTELEALAEDGDPGALQTALANEAGVTLVRVISTKDAVTYAAAPIHPGESAATVLTIGPDDRISFVAMFGQSNDAVVATAPGGVALVAVDGALLSRVPLALFDMGTELNQEPGVGVDQAPRQAAANTGADEGGTVSELDGTDVAGWSWPVVERFVELVATVE